MAIGSPGSDYPDRLLLRCARCAGLGNGEQQAHRFEGVEIPRGPEWRVGDVDPTDYARPLYRCCRCTHTSVREVDVVESAEPAEAEAEAEAEDRERPARVEPDP